MTFASLIGRRRFRGTPPAPDAPFFAIGDVHGRDDLLARLLDQIARRDPGAPVICLGDMIDRGPASAAVLHRLRAHPKAVCLMGNHEKMMLDFLDDPAGSGAPWLRHGGTATLRSFGIETAPERPAAALAAELRDALGDLHGWLRDLPLWWRSGNMACTHAGADPALPIETQDRAALLWGHRRFGERHRADGLWVLHGHVITPDPGWEPGRVWLDTGAYGTGRLSAAHVHPGEIALLTEG